ncbi:hypothetical protein EU527_16830 [Candidatus Thorarchaeota archaeon]|nr:MAG: hypothetical protein EU527_16830 [Candidatus Thorarchaeota archaeon]
MWGISFYSEIGFNISVNENTTSIFTIIERIRPEYVEYGSNEMFIVNPIIGLGRLIEVVFGLVTGSVLWILLVPGYYFFTFSYLHEIAMKSRKILSSILFTLWAILPLLVLNALYNIFFYYHGIEWILIRLPYYLASFVTILKISEYIRGEIRLYSPALWIVMSIVIVVPGALLLQWITALEMA